jgi:hypothetical protein
MSTAIEAWYPKTKMDAKLVKKQENLFLDYMRTVYPKLDEQFLKVIKPQQVIAMRQEFSNVAEHEQNLPLQYARMKLKKSVVKRIAQRMAKKMEDKHKWIDSDVSAVISDWAAENSEYLQDIVAKAFGIKVDEKYVDDEILELIEENALCKVVYEETQEFLKDRRIEHLYLFRGMFWHSDEAPSSVKNLSWDEPQKIIFKANPLTSFSCDPGIADQFLLGEGECILVMGKVPRERIFSLPMTGFGCFSEAEAVVLGGEIDLYALKRSPDNDIWWNHDGQIYDTFREGMPKQWKWTYCG